MLSPISLDKFVTYDPEEVAPRLFLTAYGQPLSRAEHYSLAKSLYPCRYVDGDTGHEWQLANAHCDHGFAAKADDMILTEKPPNQDYIYHWAFARNWYSEELWAFDEEMLFAGTEKEGI